MLEIFSMKFLGVRFWIWLYMLFGFLFIGIGFIIWNRERIRGKYYKIRYPESTIKLVIHYTGALYKVFYRIIPTDNVIKSGNTGYFYDPKSLQKHKDVFAVKEGKHFMVDIEGKNYKLLNLTAIRQKDRRFPELHYYFNNPNAINFNQELVINVNKLNPNIGKDVIDHIAEGSKEITVPTMTGKQLAEFEKQDMFNKLLALKDQNTMMFIIMVLVVVNMLISGLIALKIFDIIKSGSVAP